MQHSGGNNQEKQAKLRHQNQQKHGPSTPNNVLWQARWLWAATGTAHVLLQDCNNPRAAHSNSTVPQITHFILYSWYSMISTAVAAVATAGSAAVASPTCLNVSETRRAAHGSSNDTAAAAAAAAGSAAVVAKPKYQTRATGPPTKEPIKAHGCTRA
jgi:hypothetical protein